MRRSLLLLLLCLVPVVRTSSTPAPPHAAPAQPPAPPGYLNVATVEDILSALSIGEDALFLPEGSRLLLNGQHIHIAHNVSIISEGSGAVLDARATSRLLSIEGVHVALSKVHLENGRGDGGGGGAVTLRGGSLRAANLKVTSCTSIGYGGAIFVHSGGLLELVDARIANSSSLVHGGALAIIGEASGEAILIGVEISSCMSFGAWGGAIFAWNVSLAHLLDSIFNKCEALGRVWHSACGGAAYVSHTAEFKVIGTTFRRCEAVVGALGLEAACAGQDPCGAPTWSSPDVHVKGGALCVTDANLSVSGSTFDSCSAHCWLSRLCVVGSVHIFGGAIICDRWSGVTVLRDSTFRNCSVSCGWCSQQRLPAGGVTGGALRSSVRSTSITDCTFLSCTATSGSSSGYSSSWSAAGGAASFSHRDATVEVIDTTFRQCEAVVGTPDLVVACAGRAPCGAGLDSLPNVYASGGALSVNYVSLSVSGSTFDSCGSTVNDRAASYEHGGTWYAQGGAIYAVYASAVVVIGTSFLGCESVVGVPGLDAACGGEDPCGAATGISIYVSSGAMWMFSSALMSVSASTFDRCAAKCWLSTPCASDRISISGGAIECFGSPDIIVLRDSTFRNCSATASWCARRCVPLSATYGGAVSASIASITGCDFHSCTVSSGSTKDAFGGALGSRGEVSLATCTFSNCVAFSSRSSALGGAIMIVPSSILRMADVTIRDCHAIAIDNSFALGGAIVVGSGATAELRRVQISLCTASSFAGSAYGGAIFTTSSLGLFQQCLNGSLSNGRSYTEVYGLRPTVEMNDVTLSSCNATAAGAGNANGGLLATDGDAFVLMTNGTLLRDGFVRPGSLTDASERGALVGLSSGTVYYAAPAPLGWWAPMILCEKSFRPCDLSDPGCNRTAFGVEGVPQLCNWAEHPQLLGRYLHALSANVNYDEYPFQCGRGTYGGDLEYSSQRSSLCTGLCPPGQMCSSWGTVEPVPCPSGSYCELGAASQRPCSRGTHQPQAGQSQCIECTPGHYCRDLGTTNMEVCEPGHYCPDGTTRVRCKEGTYQPHEGGVSCMACPVGHNCDAVSMTACAPGHYCPDATTSTPCEAGTYQPHGGRVSCMGCPVGHNCVAGSVNAIPCARGFYNELPNQTNANACRSCPPSATTAEGGSVSIEDCLCEEGFFDSNVTIHVTCLPCFVGTRCEGRTGIDIHSLPVYPGYFRLDNSTTDLRRCPDASAGCGDRRTCEHSNSGCRGSGSALAEGLCRDGLTGVFCRLCAPRADGVRVYFARATSTAPAACSRCDETVRDAFLVAFGVALGAAVVILILLRTWRCLPELRQEQLRRAWRKFTLHNKLKILISFYMIAVKVDDVCEVELPPSVLQVLSVFSITISFGFSSVGTVLECLGMRGYLAMLLVYMVTPLALAMLIVFVTLARLLYAGRLSPAALRETAAPPLLILAFVAYPLVTNVAFDAFSCHALYEGDGRKLEWLKADVAIQCGSAAHEEAKAYAWAAICLYPIGLLVLFAALLLRARKAIVAGRPTRLRRAISFLHREFLPHLFFWELVEMGRRFLLVGIMVLGQGSMRQLVVGTLLSAVFLLFQVQASPYKDMSDDFLASTASFCLVALFLTCTAYKHSALTGLEKIRFAMSREQLEIYADDQAVLTAIVVACVCGAIAASLAIFVVQLAAEGARLRREELMGRARRLRYRSSDVVVEAPAVEADGYHLFLSHVWGTGQDQMRIVKQRLVEMVPALKVFLDVDDLVDIAHLDEYVAATQTVLVFCSDGYFKSRNCMVELRSAVQKGKQMIALLEREESRGGLSEKEVRERLVEADASYEAWGFTQQQQAPQRRRSTRLSNDRRSSRVSAASASVRQSTIHLPSWPCGEDLFDALFTDEPIEWNRISCFQDVTLRLIAERVLRTGRMGDGRAVYVQGELVNQTMPTLRPPQPSLRHSHGGACYHMYCSELNPGAAELIEELRGVQRSMGDIAVTRDIDALEGCSQMLVYLTRLTWTRGEASAAFAAEVERAMEANVRILLAHEMNGCGGQEARHGCEFKRFFSCVDGATPCRLLQRGIYGKIAVPLKGGAWREASMAQLARSIASAESEASIEAEAEAEAGSHSSGGGRSTSGRKASSRSGSVGTVRLERRSKLKARGGDKVRAVVQFSKVKATLTTEPLFDVEGRDHAEPEDRADGRAEGAGMQGEVDEEVGGTRDLEVGGESNTPGALQTAPPPAGSTTFRRELAQVLWEIDL